MGRAIGKDAWVGCDLGRGADVVTAEESGVNEVARAAGVDEDACWVGAEAAWENEEVGGGGGGSRRRLCVEEFVGVQGVDRGALSDSAAELRR